jgi:hypothetical protein
MQEVRYEDYENQTRQAQRFLVNEEERHETPLYQKVGIAAIATAGLLALGHRTGVLRKVADYLDTEARMSLRAIREILNEESALRKDISMQRIRIIRDRYQERKQELFSKYKREPKEILSKREYDMERFLRQRQRLIEKDIPFHIEEGLRFEAVMKDVRAVLNDKKLADRIEHALGRGEVDLLRYGTNSDINALLRSQGIESNDIIKMVLEARQRHRRTRFIATEEGIAWVEGMQKKLREFTAQQMQDITKRNGEIKSFVIGHRQATVGDILKLHEAGKININVDLHAQIQDVLKYNKDFKKAVFDENLYVRTVNGEMELFDYKVFNEIGRKHMEWWANTLPGGLLHLRDFLNIRAAREQASFRVFKRGTIQPVLNAHRGIENKEPLRDPVVFVNGKFVRLFDANAINNDVPLTVLNPKRDMYLTSARFGTIGKITRHIGDLMTEDKERNAVFRLLDIGNQDKDSTFNEYISVITKFFNKEWERNLFNQAFRRGVKTKDEFYEMQKYFKHFTEGFTPRLLNQLKQDLPEYLQKFIDENDINFSRQEDILKLFKELHQNNAYRFNDQGEIIGRKKVENWDLYRLYQQFERNSDELLGRAYPIGETNPFIGGNVRVQTGMNLIEQQVGLELIRQIVKVKPAGIISEEQALENLRNRISQLQKTGDILTSDAQKAEWLINYYMFQQAAKPMYRNEEEALKNLNVLFRGKGEAEQAFQQSLGEMLKSTHPVWQSFKGNKPENLIRDEYIAVNKAFSSHTFLGRINEFFTDFPDKAKQLSFFTGRRNMEDVTTLSIFGSYYPWYRLQDALGNVGLGFSDDSMGSPLQLISSLFLKRIFPVFAGVTAYKYIDYETDKYTGTGISERWENYKAYRRLEEAIAREQFGTLDEMQRERMLRPGIEHFDDAPSFYIPMIGEVGPGDLFNLIAGTISGTGYSSIHKEDTMGVEETYQDITEGVEEVRKGRWWAFGSKTAYRGDRVIQYAPNSYRLAHSDWEYTDVIGSGEEVWGNSLFPTIENWFGLKHLLGMTDLYWFERKHYYDRPYLLTGELFNSNTPLVGDLGNLIIGNLLKPVRPMHMEYWGNPLIVQEQTEQYGERPEEPVITRISPSGRIEYSVFASPEGYGGYQEGQETPVLIPVDQLNPEAAQIVERELKPYEEENMPPPKQYLLIPRQNAETGEPTGDVIIYDTESEEAIYLPARMQGEYRSINEAFYAARAAESNHENVLIETEPRDLYAPVYEYQKNVDRRKLMELNDPRSVSWRAQEFASNWLEPHGIYNWILMDEFLGRDPYTGQMVIEKADKAYNASNAFWESELGSLGGSFSEIFRRFIRRDSSQLEGYNPIRNTMPDWLPGSNYFINFQVGDPYSKIPFGEYRLPGPAYESLNELHPDEFGKYGAFDRFKILADVAPWSDEYKFWRDYVTKYIEDPELRKQIAQIKRQVAKRKKKYEFHEYIFKDAEIEKVKVTVRKFLDDYTFLTEEFGDTPIRLAGVDPRVNAEGVLQQYFQEGDKIVIGIAADPTQRISDDTYGTMKAVVFRGLESLNRQLIERGEMKENIAETSAPGIWARFTPGEISKGSRWESIAHFESALNTKFLQVRTALEEYERDQVYGKNWATWENFGISDYLIPALDRMKGHDNPFMATMSGFFVGGFIGRIILGGGKNTKYGAILGAATGFTLNLLGKAYEKVTGERWIPERRRIENEINEYFDILKYLKFSGLYEKAKEELRHMGYDADELLAEIEEKERQTKERRRQLEEEKKWLYLNQPKGWEERRKEINRELQEISEQWDELVLPGPVAQALYYKEQRDSTLYAIDPYEDRMKIIEALPYKDKWFFNEFAEASLEEQEKVLELVPENQRRIYKAIWGYGLEPQKPIEYYAQKYNIPDPTWEGWRPEYNLEDIKLKVVQQYGLDLSDFNYWNDDIEAAQYVPDIPYEDIHAAPPPFRGYKDVEQNIRDIMQGQGLYDVQVTVQPSYGNETNVYIEYEEDRSKEIEREFKYNMDSYLS